MPSWWSKIKALLTQSELSTPTRPAIHEVIKRSEEFLQEYEIWKGGPQHKKMLNWISEQYAIYQKKGREQSEHIDFLYTASAKGMAIHLADIEYGIDEARFLMDFFKERIREVHQYRTQVSDTRTYSMKTWVETVERHYLKPRPQYNEAGRIAQGFGNITLLLTLRDDKLYNFKLSATAYQDRLFSVEEQFSDLMRVITF